MHNSMGQVLSPCAYSYPLLHVTSFVAIGVLELGGLEDSRYSLFAVLY